MAIKRVVSVDFWTDGNVMDMFSAEDKYFMLYLLTNPHTTQLGIYKFNCKLAAFELGLSVETVKVVLDRFENKYHLLRYSASTQEIAIKNYLRHSVITGGKPVKDLLAKELGQVKNKDLVHYVFSWLKKQEKLNATVLEVVNDYFNENDNDNENDNENEKSYPLSFNDSLDDSSSLAPESTLVDDVIQEYNRICKSLPAVKSKTDKRMKAIKARLKENGKSLDFFVGYFHRVEASDFLTNRSGKGWKANFDWLINQSNMAKVLEGNYDNSDKRQLGTNTPKNDVAGTVDIILAEMRARDEQRNGSSEGNGDDVWSLWTGQ